MMRPAIIQRNAVQKDEKLLSCRVLALLAALDHYSFLQTLFDLIPFQRSLDQSCAIESGKVFTCKGLGYHTKYLIAAFLSSSYNIIHFLSAASMWLGCSDPPILI